MYLIKNNLLIFFNSQNNHQEKDPLIEEGVPKETVVTSAKRNGKPSVSLAKDSAV